MKLYYYILYKILHFRSAIGVRKLDYGNVVRLHAAGMFFVFTWPLFAGVAFWVLGRLRSSGAQLSRTASEFLFVALVILPVGLIAWFNYRLLRSTSWRIYAAEFASYSRLRRKFSSVAISLLLISIFSVSLLFLFRVGY